MSCSYQLQWFKQTEESIRDSELRKKARIEGTELDSVQHLCCIQGMKSLPDNSLDIAIADPPYNVSKGGDWSWDNSVQLPGFGGDWKKVMEAWDNMALVDYFNFTLQWLRELKRIVKPIGSIWIHGTYHNIGIINFALQILEIEIINEVVWYKRNSFPNLSGRRLTASHETILWAHTGKKREYNFNYEAIKKIEFPEDNLKKSGKQMRTVWDIPNNKSKEELKFGKHPTQKPIRLINRMLKISSKPGWKCLVPFAGAGSECVAARENGLSFLAFETDSKYVDISRKRLNLPAGSSEMEKAHLNRRHGKRTNTALLRRNVPSLIKWTGSKRSQATIIASYIPQHNRYFEPFLGGGALLYLYAEKGSVGSDIYKPLIEFWQLVKNKPDVLIDDYTSKWNLLQKDGQSVYYEIRERFNKSRKATDLNFLMRTCVNGIVRFNEAGNFNNSFHLSRKGMRPERFRVVVNRWHDTIQDVEFICQDYELTTAMARKGDFIYFDPPYVGNCNRYIKDLDVDRFFTTLEQLNKKKVKWALSFDGSRGNVDYQVVKTPEHLYLRKISIPSGNSAVSKVLNGPVEQVQETLYLNY